MQRILIVLLGMASIVASGVIFDQGRAGFNTFQGLGFQTTRGTNQGVVLDVNTLTRDELLCQKFILDILCQVNKPLQQQDLVNLDDTNKITNENLYTRPLTQEMLLVLDLIQADQMLGKQTICRITNEQHVRQMVGLYRLFVNARNFDTFKRLAVYARQNVNTEMFVNCLILALGERHDTKKVIVPALHEILPQLFHHDRIIDQVRQLDTGISSVRPQLVDVIGMGRQNRFYNNYIANQNSGLLGVLNKSQLFMPWRELHQQLALRKFAGNNLIQQDVQQTDKLTVSLSGNGFLSQDLDFKAYVNILIDELIVNQDNIKNANTNQIGAERYQGDVRKYFGNNDNNDDDDVFSQRSNVFGKRIGGRRSDFQNTGLNFDNEQNINNNRGFYGGRQFDNNGEYEQYKNRYNQFGRRNFQEENQGINTVNVNDARLLFVGRRRQNQNNQNQYDDNEMISGGRHVFNDKNEYKKSKYNNQDNDDEAFYNFRKINSQRQNSQERYTLNDDDNDNDFGRNSYNGQGKKQYNNNDQDSFFRQGYTGQRNQFNNLNQDRGFNYRQGDFNDKYAQDRFNQRENFGGSTFDEEFLDQRYNNENKYGKDSSSGRRYRRSLINEEQFVGQDNTFAGKLLLHNLQQLVARLNIERIALGQPQLIDTQTSKGRGLINIAGRVTINRNDIQGVDFQTVNKIENIIQRIDQVLEQTVGQNTFGSYNKKINEIGLMLAGQIQEIGLIEILGELFQQGGVQQQQNKCTLANIIEKESAQILLAGIVKVVDNKVQQVFRQRKEFNSNADDVTINNVDVDYLQTYLEYADIDLSNLAKNDFEQIARGNNKVVVGRVPRLNHKEFNIKVDVTSDRQQQVIVRNLLVPKVDGNGNIIPLEDNRQNVIVLDIATVQLKQGQNTLKFKSNDITITAPDTTPLTKIYQQVMQALNGETQSQQNILVGQSNMLPHRLLLPRGRINGLPMQLITVITPVEQTWGTNGNGLAALLFDRLPLNYPLNCDISQLETVASKSNVLVKDVKIYHNDNKLTQTYGY